MVVVGEDLVAAASAEVTPVAVSTAAAAFVVAVLVASTRQPLCSLVRAEAELAAVEVESASADRSSKGEFRTLLSEAGASRAELGCCQ